MSAEMCTGNWAITIKDGDHLPAGVDQDDVSAEATQVVERALDAWYRARGHMFLACEPS